MVLQFIYTLSHMLALKVPLVDNIQVWFPIQFIVCFREMQLFNLATFQILLPTLREDDTINYLQPLIQQPAAARGLAAASSYKC